MSSDTGDPAESVIHRSSSETGTSRLRPRRTSRSSGATLASKKSGPTPMAAAASAGVSAMRGIDVLSFLATAQPLNLNALAMSKCFGVGSANFPPICMSNRGGRLAARPPGAERTLIRMCLVHLLDAVETRPTRITSRSPSTAPARRSAPGRSPAPSPAPAVARPVGCAADSNRSARSRPSARHRVPARDR
jgi:hypothetical protein